MVSGCASGSDYALAKLWFRLPKLRCHTLYVSLMSNSYPERRCQSRLFFHDSSVKKINRQALKNRLPVLLCQIKFNRLNTISPNLIRINLKMSFFHYRVRTQACGHLKATLDYGLTKKTPNNSQHKSVHLMKKKIARPVSCSCKTLSNFP